MDSSHTDDVNEYVWGEPAFADFTGDYFIPMWARSAAGVQANIRLSATTKTPYKILFTRGREFDVPPGTSVEEAKAMTIALLRMS